jgi:hypothetical protein
MSRVGKPVKPPACQQGAAGVIMEVHPPVDGEGQVAQVDLELMSQKLPIHGCEAHADHEFLQQAVSLVPGNLLDPVDAIRGVEVVGAVDALGRSLVDRYGTAVGWLA